MTHETVIKCHREMDRLNPATPLQDEHGDSHVSRISSTKIDRNRREFVAASVLPILGTHPSTNRKPRPPAWS